MTKWRKITICVTVSIIVIAVIYDIIVFNKSPGDTESNVIMTAIYNFPFFGYALGVITGHFLSLVKTKKSHIKQLVITSAALLILSTLMFVFKMHIRVPTVAIFSLTGFGAGTFWWSQRRLS